MFVVLLNYGGGLSVVCLPALGSGSAGFLSFLGAVAGEVAGLVAVVAVASGGRGGGGSIVLEAVRILAPRFPWVLLRSIGDPACRYRTSGRSKNCTDFGAVFPRLVWLGTVPALVVLGASISSRTFANLPDCAGAPSFQVLESSGASSLCLRSVLLTVLWRG